MTEYIRVPRTVLADLEADLPCLFWACDGPDAPYEAMKTCRSCSTRQRLRALLGDHPTPAPEPSRLTIADFITYWGITLVGLDVARPDDDFHQGDPGRSWSVTIGREGRSDRMTVPFHQGSGLTALPTLRDVLSVLAKGAALIENTDGFEAWVAELGYDLGDSALRARRTYDQAVMQTRELEALLGDDGFHTLLWETGNE